MKKRMLLLAAAIPLLTALPLTAQTTRGNVQGRIPLASAAATPATYQILDSLVNAFSYYSYTNQPVRYDPITNTVATIMRGSSVSGSDKLFVRFSTDQGATWSNAVGPVFDGNAGGAFPARYPSLIFNPNGATSVSEADIFYTAPILTGAGGTFDGFTEGLVQSDGTQLIPAVTSTGYLTHGWGSDAFSVATNGGGAVLSTGRLSDNSMGLRRLDLTTGILTTVVPPQWMNGVMAFVAADTTALWFTNVGLDKDPNGTIYSAISGVSPDEDTSVARSIPAVSKSTDNGTTWSSFDYFTLADFRAQATAFGLDPDSTSSSRPVAFKVTGNDQYSFLLNIFESNATKATTFSNVVELYRNAGTWGARIVAPTSGRVFLYINGSAVGDTTSQTDNELQLSQTADKSKLIAKWVDLVQYTFTQDIDADGNSPDTLITSDVFVSMRNTAGTTWGAPVNVTNTPVLDREAWFPDVMPNDLTRMPMVSVQSIVDASTATIRQQLFDSQRLLVDLPQYVVASQLDGSSAAGISSPISSKHFSVVALSNVQPNPVVKQASVAYTLPKSGRATVELYNSNGQRMGILSDATQEAGAYRVNIDGSKLASGSYIVSVTFGGQRSAQSFNVVH